METPSALGLLEFAKVMVSFPLEAFIVQQKAAMLASKPVPDVPPETT
jgi:hypothetical protein